MYLKSIEVQGFKSFANKIVFDFEKGITGIVGPNGSGKSNVADAVRWVLGEQSAKQLRGSKMEDVIFAGTQNRKPVGFAFVSITLDNSDHALAVDYDEVTVSRRVYRSGESEYLINGNACRLKDVTELFYDTGIGKEGYSIIGQGQIDKILSGKPEERRELFDEAAGIVKFKRRKAAAIKKLDNERANLVRVNDILSELEKQVGPLKIQSDKAKEYLNLKSDLKKYDVNAFLLETDRIRGELETLDGKINIADTDLETAKKEYDTIKSEYEIAESELENVNSSIENYNNEKNESELENQRLEGTINVYQEQIKTYENNNTIHKERLNTITEEIASKNAAITKQEGDLAEIKEDLETHDERLDSVNKESDEIKEKIASVQEKIDEKNKSIIDALNEKSSINAENQKYVTMLENLSIKKAELSSKVIKDKSDEAAQQKLIDTLNESLLEAETEVNEINKKLVKNNEEVTNLKGENATINASIDKITSKYHREKSRLESLINITERYDGYGNSIREIMKLKDSNSGILGVIADIVKVERSYEVAIETALGGTIQNIVTDKEETAKDLIAYLKENKLGRATFLPLNAIKPRETLEKDNCIKEAGVIGVASNLVKVSYEYENLAKYLLGRILVVDNINNALQIARKYRYSLRIVTLEGEQLNPGGSMTGGAFKNSSNLLGRRREIEELKKNVSETSKEANELKKSISDNRAKIASIREVNEELTKQLRESSLRKNTIQVNLNQEQNKLKAITELVAKDALEIKIADEEINKITQSKSLVSDNLDELDVQNEKTKAEIESLTKYLDELKDDEVKISVNQENIKLLYNSYTQKITFIEENINRLNEEVKKLVMEESDIKAKIQTTKTEIINKNKDISDVKKSINLANFRIKECQEKIEALRIKKDEISKNHKSSFDKRDKINNTIVSLEKESMRLHTQHEKLDEANDSLVDYMWNEYELTYSYALELKNEDLTNLNDIRKQINILKSSIKKLGDVNVNAIEEYKGVSERYEFLKGQHDDMIEAENALMQVIDELDTGMRTQFSAKFEEIKKEFDQVFKELFGGGKGTIELVEGEDILEAGITIISQPPGKKLQNMMQLSGGEKALTAIALLFAIQNLKPSPFCLLDEIEAALDDSNVGRYANYLHKLTKHTQFIVITHRRGTMAAADRLFGITMQEKGVSTLVSVDLIDKELEKEKNQKKEKTA